MRDFHHGGIRPERVVQVGDNLLRLGIHSGHMPQRNIDRAALRRREAHAHDMRPVRIERGPRVCAVFRIRRGFKIEGHNGRILKIIFNPAHVRLASVIHSNTSNGGPDARPSAS